MGREGKGRHKMGRGGEGREGKEWGGEEEESGKAKRIGRAR